MVEPRLDEWITVKDKTHKRSILYFEYRICCNHIINGEMSLFRSVVKNVPENAMLFDVGAAGSQYPLEIKDTMSLHLFDPVFIPSGEKWKDEIAYTMCKKPVDYSKPNIHVNETAVDDAENSISKYCKERDIKHIDFLKIDTDGHDLGVLKGLGDITVDMVQFEYDNFYRKYDLNIQDMFDLLPGWHFFYILPSGLIKIDTMRNDYIYTNILATKEYPHNVIRDYEIMLKNNTVNVDHIGEFLSNLYWEYKHISPDQFKSGCLKIEDPETRPNIDINMLIKKYNAIYD
jgi:hypothetical protein